MYMCKTQVLEDGCAKHIKKLIACRNAYNAYKNDFYFHQLDNRNMDKDKLRKFSSRLRTQRSQRMLTDFEVRHNKT